MMNAYFIALAARQAFFCMNGAERPSHPHLFKEFLEACLALKNPSLGMISLKICYILLLYT
jgi:hypothetical protein